MSCLPVKGRRSRGFSLVELLVVIGIIGLLLAILLPVLSAARRRGRQVQCMSNQRQVATAMQARLQDTHGYLPLAGMITLPPDTSGLGSLPMALNDASRTRYDYSLPAAVNPAEQSLLPVPLALLPHLELDSLDSSVYYPDADAEQSASLRVFTCPAATVLEGHAPVATSAIKIGMPYIVQSAVRSDFAFNETVVGFDHRGRFDRQRLRGQASRITSPARTVLLGDAAVGGSAHTMTWATALDADVDEATLADVLAKSPSAGPSKQFDLDRHDGKANIAFADGHVATLPIKPQAFSKAYLLSE